MEAETLGLVAECIMGGMVFRTVAAAAACIVAVYVG